LKGALPTGNFVNCAESDVKNNGAVVVKLIGLTSAFDPKHSKGLLGWRSRY
jgi:hypothetical protein